MSFVKSLFEFKGESYKELSFPPYATYYQRLFKMLTCTRGKVFVLLESNGDGWSKVLPFFCCPIGGGLYIVLNS